MQELDRRHFIKTATITGLGVYALAAGQSDNQSFPHVVITQNANPATLVKHAIDNLGGMQSFVKKGQSVLIKPNIGWDRLPEQAANTNPEIVAQVVKMCKEQGAKRIRVLDRTCNEPKRCYLNSGIEKAAKDAGAQVRHVVDSRFIDVDLPQGVLIKKWPVYKDVLDFDVLINIPIAKDHTVSRLTLGMKNIMGVLGGDRGQLHRDFHTAIVDVNTGIHTTLTIIDAYRVLLRNGPSGGNINDVEEKKTVIVSADRVAADACAADLFGIHPQELEYLQNAASRGLGVADLEKLNIRSIDLSA